MAKKLYKCNECGYEWRKGGVSFLPKCPECGSHDVSELKGGKQREYDESTEDVDEASEQGLGI